MLKLFLILILTLFLQQINWNPLTTNIQYQASKEENIRK